MFEKHKPLQDQYVEFMGMWAGGTVVGYVLTKIIIWGLILWGLTKLCCN